MTSEPMYGSLLFLTSLSSPGIKIECRARLGNGSGAINFVIMLPWYFWTSLSEGNNQKHGSSTTSC